MRSFLILLALVQVFQFSVAQIRFAKDKKLNGKFGVIGEPLLTETVPLVDEVHTRWIEQRLNNFDPQDNRTWQMRYLENNDNFVEGSPIFIYVGGEWTVSPGWLRGGHMYDMGVNHSALMFYTEHRYYGNSRPTEDLTVENLRWLNIDQALADLAHFITHIKATYPGTENSRVIMVGCSYASTMVTWFRQKYPHLVSGVWAVSGPLLAKVDFNEYKETVSMAMGLIGGTECQDRIQNAFLEMERIVDTGDTSHLDNRFGLCEPLNTADQIDVSSFFASMSGPFSGVVQSHREGDIESVCEYLMRAHEDDLEALALTVYGRQPLEGEACWDYSLNSSIEFFAETSWDSDAANSEWRQWYYQTCSEYGWYQGSGTTSNGSIFGSSSPVDGSVAICTHAYDSEIFSSERVHENIDITNVLYGAFNPSTTNVFSTHGEIDPWRPMGVQEDINDSSPTFIMARQAHCSNLNSIRDTDSPDVLESKQRIAELVRMWLEV